MNNKKTKIILAGTPQFVTSIFEKVIQNFNVVAIISQPDRPIGRGMKLTPTPTKILANKYQIQVYQPQKIIDIFQELQEIEFDILLTVAYGQIIPEKILNLASKGSYNIHFSLLPKYRGSSPIQYALLNGDEITGVTFMEMIKEMDAGDLIFQEKIIIDKKDNFDSLLHKLSKLSSDNIVLWINSIVSKNFKKTKQDGSLITFAPKISKGDEEIKKTTMLETINKIRALSSKPGAYLFYEWNGINKRLKIYEATFQKTKNSLEINCTDGSIYAIDYQFEGKKRIKI